MTMIGHEIKCLDHGYVKLVDVMGNDQRIVEAARLSVSGENVRKVSEDRALIRYMMRHQHWTPFETVEFVFDQKLPIFVARQQVRHRTAVINEMSARYGELPEEFYVPALADIAFQAKKNKQGRAEPLPEELAQQVAWSLAGGASAAFWAYHRLLGKPIELEEEYEFRSAVAEGGGVARELARINLPLSAFTRWYWKIDLRNLFNFLKLRLDPHAQMEIRVYAEAMAEIVKQVCPLAYEAFEDYHLHAMTFSRQELVVLARMAQWVSEASPSAYEALVTTTKDGVPLVWPTAREGEEFAAKLAKLDRMVT